MLLLSVMTRSGINSSISSSSACFIFCPHLLDVPITDHQKRKTLLQVYARRKRLSPARLTHTSPSSWKKKRKRKNNRELSEPVLEWTQRCIGYERCQLLRSMQSLTELRMSTRSNLALAANGISSSTNMKICRSLLADENLDGCRRLQAVSSKVGEEESIGW